MSGTYHQFNDATPYWFRESTECDTRPSWLLFHGGTFIVWDTFDDIDIAVCKLPREYYRNKTSWDTMKFRPDLCESWQTLRNSAIGGSYALDYDESFQIFMDGSCTDYSCSTTTAPDEICFSQTTNGYAFMEGNYEKTSFTGDVFGYPTYKRSEEIYYDGSLIEVYMWYYGEIESADLHWWVLSSSTLEEAIAANGSVGVYAFCEADVQNPVDCTAGWRFHFVNHFAMDESFVMSPGQCAVSTTKTSVMWPEYLCIESGSTGDSYVPSGYYTGAYKINETGTHQSGNVPHYVKPQNDNWRRNDVYLYLDGFYGWWQV